MAFSLKLVVGVAVAVATGYFTSKKTRTSSDTIISSLALEDAPHRKPAEPEPLDPVVRQLVFHMKPTHGTIVGVTSAISGEGKTTIARALVQRLRYWTGPQRAVVLEDCSQGASAGPRAQRHAHELGHQLVGEPGFPPRLIQADSLPIPRSELARTLEELGRQHAFVVLDLPPLLADPSAAEIACAVDRLYLVVRSGSTTVPLLQQALERLGGHRVEAVILNDARPGLPGWLARLVS